MKNPTFPVALSIGGSDSSAGAGVQADLKSMGALGVYGVSAVTCVVAEAPGKVSRIQAVEPEIVAEQIRVLFDAFPIAAMKTGLLYSGEIIEAVCAALVGCLEKSSHRASIIVDPVMVATSGDPLLKPEAVNLYQERLFPMATLVTPNLDEARALSGRPISNLEEMRVAGLELAAAYRCAFLIKGGHLQKNPAIDLLCLADGGVEEYSAPYIEGIATHGTGCTYSAAIAAGLAKGASLPQAVADAKKFVTHALMHFLRWEMNGRTTDALHHFADRSRLAQTH